MRTAFVALLFTSGRSATISTACSATASLDSAKSSVCGQVVVHADIGHGVRGIADERGPERIDACGHIEDRYNRR